MKFRIGTPFLILLGLFLFVRATPYSDVGSFRSQWSPSSWNDEPLNPTQEFEESEEQKSRHLVEMQPEMDVERLEAPESHPAVRSRSESESESEEWPGVRDYSFIQNVGPIYSDDSSIPFQETRPLTHQDQGQGQRDHEGDHPNGAGSFQNFQNEFSSADTPYSPTFQNVLDNYQNYETLTSTTFPDQSEETSSLEVPSNSHPRNSDTPFPMPIHLSMEMRDVRPRELRPDPDTFGPYQNYNRPYGQGHRQIIPDDEQEDQSDEYRIEDMESNENLPANHNFRSDYYMI